MLNGEARELRVRRMLGVVSESESDAPIIDVLWGSTTNEDGDDLGIVAFVSATWQEVGVGCV